MAHRLRNFLLFFGLFLISVPKISAQGCTYIQGVNSSVSGNSVTCTLSEVASPGLVCDFSVNGLATITLTRYSDINILDYMTLTTDDAAGHTKASLVLQNSVDDIADTASFLMGTLTCSPYLQQDRWRAMIDGRSDTTSYLTVTFVNVNDHDPAFSQAEPYVVNGLSEAFPDNLDVLATYDVFVNATDGDNMDDSSSWIEFSLQDDYSGSFEVQTTKYGDSVYTMSLNVMKVLDYTTYSSYDLTVIATDKGSPPHSSSATLTLNVVDGDNLDPKFDYMFYSTDVTALNAGQQVLAMNPAAISAKDQDIGINVAVTYALQFNNLDSECSAQCQAMQEAFTIDTQTGIITMDTNVNLDVITSRVASFAVTATQVDDSRHSANAFVSVSLPQSTTTTPPPTTLPTTESTGTTINPCTTFFSTPCPTFPPCPTVDTTTVCPTPPPCPTDTTTILVTTECPTLPPCPTDTTTACPTPPPCPTVDTTTTVVTVPTTCPPPPTCPTVDTTTTVVTVPTTCPTPPPCPTVHTTTVVTEPSTCPTPPPCPTGDTSTATTNCPPCPTDTTTRPSDHTGTSTDCVCPTAGTVITVSTECPTATPGAPTPPPAPTTAPGTTTTTVPRSTYPPAPANNLIITVKNVSVYTEPGTVLVQMQEASEGEYQYTLESNTGYASSYFDIDSSTGDVFVKSKLHYSSSPYELMIFAEGSNGHDSATLNIEVVNTAGIAVLDPVAQSFSFAEGDYTNKYICSIDSYYEDNGYTRTYAILKVNPDVDKFTVNPSTGDLTFTGTLDYETSHTYDVTVTVTTNGGRSSNRGLVLSEDSVLQYNQALVHIDVVDVNDNPPVFVMFGQDDSKYVVGISSYTSSGQDVVQLITTDADTENDYVQAVYELDDDNFYVDKDTGVIRASTSMENLEFAISDRSSYSLTVIAHNIDNEDSIQSSLNVKVYILSGDQILLMNTTLTPESFNDQCSNILNTLKEETGTDIRVLEWEDNKSAARRSSRSNALGDSSVVTTVYLYALGDDAPLGRDDLLQLIEEESDVFGDAGFIVSSAVIYSDVGELILADDNSYWIIIISCLAAAAGVLLILFAVFCALYVMQKKKVNSINSTLGTKSADYDRRRYSDNSEKHPNGHAVQALSPGWTSPVQTSQDDPLRTDNDTAVLVAEPPLYEDETASQGFQDADSLGFQDNDNDGYQGNDNMGFQDVDSQEIKPEVVTHVENGNPLDDEDVYPEHQEHQEPDPDYLQSILVDPKAPRNDEDSRSTKSGVTFNETAEVISVLPMDNENDFIDDSAQL